MLGEKSRFSGGYLAISFIVGAITGVAVALLTAPYSGSEARAHVGRLVRRGREKIWATHHKAFSPHQ